MLVFPANHQNFEKSREKPRKIAINREKSHLWTIAYVRNFLMIEVKKMMNILYWWFTVALNSIKQIFFSLIAYGDKDGNIINALKLFFFFCNVLFFLQTIYAMDFSFSFCCSFLCLSVASSKNLPSCWHPIFSDIDSPFHLCLDEIVHLVLHYNLLDFEESSRGGSVESAV